jgi:WD40 repeat protein
MSDASPVLKSSPTPSASNTFDAFLSYTHTDRPVVSGMQNGLHRIGRRLGQLRALRVFRDDTDLTASPDLWGRIADAIDRSRFFIVTLSPNAAASHWVNKEIDYWLSRRGDGQLMLVLAGGRLRWDEATARFDPQESDAAPPVLTEIGSLPTEPLFIDVSADAPWDYRNAGFRDKLTALAAPIHGKPKDQLASDDLREQRRFRRLRAAAITGLVVLTVVALVAAVVAVYQRQQAIRHLHDAVVAKLNAEGAAMLAGSTAGGDTRALQELLAAHAIAGTSDAVPILDAQIARFTTEKIIPTGSWVRQVAYNPDGSRVATAQNDGTVRQWQAADGKPVGSSTNGRSQPTTAVAYSPNGNLIASTNFDGTLELSDVDNGTVLTSGPAGGASLVSVAFSPDGKLLIAGDNDDHIQTFDPHTGKRRSTQEVFDQNGVAISDVTFDRSGKLFAVSGNNGEVSIVDVDTGNRHAPSIVVPGIGAASNPVWRIAFSPDGHSIALASNDLEVWNADTGKLVRSIGVGTSRSTMVTAVAFSHDGTRLATGRIDGVVQLWSTDDGTQLGSSLTGHTGAVSGVAFRPDDLQFATTSQDHTLRLWNAKVGEPMKAAPSAATSAVFSPDGHQIAAAGDTAVARWDVGTGQALPPLTPDGDGARSVAFAGADRIITTAADGTIQIWDAATGQSAQPPIRLPAPGRDTSFAVRSDGKEIAVADDAKAAVQLFDIPSGRPLSQPLTVHTAKATMYAVAFSPDGHQLAGGYNDGLRIWNIDTGQPEGNLLADPHSLPVLSVAFSRDGATVAAGRVDGAVELWSAATQKPLPDNPLTGHIGQVMSVAFGIGPQLASGGIDADLRLWDTTSGTATAAPIPQSDAVTSVAMSPGGQLVALTTLDGTVMLAPARTDPAQLCSKLTTNMTHHQWRDWVSPDIGYITQCPGLPIAPD